MQSKGVGFEEFDVDAYPALRNEMTQRSGGRRTVPQIFIDDRHIGGSDELVALEREGRLSGMLQVE